MRRTLAAAALLAAIAQAAVVQPALAQGAPAAPQDFPPDLPARSAPPPRGGTPDRPRLQLFISPSGEPFREPGDGMAAWIARADTNHDGAVSLEEFRADAQRAFKLYDANGDGRIDGFEIGAYENELVPEITALTMDGAPGGGAGRGFFGRRKGGGPPQPAGAGRDGAAGYSLLNEPQPVANADANLDGRVSAQEWAQATARSFARLDVGKTGLLTHDSLRPPPGAKKPQPPK